MLLFPKIVMPISDNEAKIRVKVYPGAARNEVVGFAAGVLQVRVSAPPVKGKANKELIAFLSRLLGIGKSRIDISRGHTVRNKVIVIYGLSQQEITKRLLPNLYP